MKERKKKRKKKGFSLLNGDCCTILKVHDVLNFSFHSEDQ